MLFSTGLDKLKSQNQIPPLLCEDEVLNELLNGGFRKDLIYLLCGDRKITTDILLTTSVRAQLSLEKNGLGLDTKVAFVDGNNRFNPYNISRYAVSFNLSPQKTLENILIARAFTWEQMVELLEHKISKLEDIKVVLISGITSMFTSYKDKKSFHGLLQAIKGIKKILKKIEPLIILSAPLNKFSEYKPEGGKILTHFGQVIVVIKKNERFIEYNLIEHPSLPEKSTKKYFPRKSKRNLKISKNTTLDNWF